jgi:hypothetical protein
MPTQLYVYTGETCVPPQATATGSPTFTSLGTLITLDNNLLDFNDFLVEGDWVFSSSNSELRRVERILDGGVNALINEAFTTDIEDALAVTSFDITDAGTGYSNASGVATTGGSGTGLTVDVTQTAGVIDTAVIAAAGEGYIVGDIVTIDAGNSDATLEITGVEGNLLQIVKASRARYIDLANTGGASATIDGVTLANGLTLNLGKDPLYRGSQRDYVDPMVLDATGTSVTVSIQY